MRDDDDKSTNGSITKGGGQWCGSIITRFRWSVAMMPVRRRRGGGGGGDLFDESSSRRRFGKRVSVVSSAAGDIALVLPQVSMSGWMHCTISIKINATQLTKQNTEVYFNKFATSWPKMVNLAGVNKPPPLGKTKT